MRPRKGLKALLAIISSLVSFAIAGYAFYLVSLTNYWFITIGVYFAFEGLFIIIASAIKDEYKAMRVQGVFQILGVILMMDYLLVMALWNDPYQVMVYQFSYVFFGVAAGLKGLTCLISTIAVKKYYSPILHAFRNNDLITLFYLLLIIELIITNQFYPGTSVNIFDNLFKEKPIWIYIIDASLNATFTIMAALLALSTDIRSKTREELTTVGKIKHTAQWFNDNEVSMFMGLVFTMYLAIIAFLNVKLHWFYIVLGCFYLGTATIRLINYLWHKAIVKKCGNNKIRENRLSSFILLFDAFAYFFFSFVISGAAIFLMVTDANVGKNIYLFLFIVVPFGILRLVTAVKGIRKYRRENDTYHLGLGYISLISVFFSLTEIIAITMYFAPTILKYITIIGVVSILQIVVLIVCVTFVIHFVRSLIINRRGKEKGSK